MNRGDREASSQCKILMKHSIAWHGTFDENGNRKVCIRYRNAHKL